MEGKELPVALDVEGQVQNLIELGLQVEDEDEARDVLNRISYFRLIKAYSLGLKPKNGKYNSDVLFSQIVDLYDFNAELRGLIFPIVESIEVALRCRVANYFCGKYGVLGYESPENFDSEELHENFVKDIAMEVNRNSQNPFVRNFKQNYQDGKIPFYALVELMSFGDLSKFFKNMKSEAKKAVAKYFGVGYTYLESWLENLCYVRNICAHYGRLYNAKFSKTPMLYKEHTAAGIKNHRLFATIIICGKLLPEKERWLPFVAELKNLTVKYPAADVSTMGFPPNWEEILNNA